jgi:hypothetical protein
VTFTVWTHNLTLGTLVHIFIGQSGHSNHVLVPNAKIMETSSHTIRVTDRKKNAEYYPTIRDRSGIIGVWKLLIDTYIINKCEYKVWWILHRLSLLISKMEPLDTTLYACVSNQPLWDYCLYIKIKYIRTRIYLWLHFYSSKIKFYLKKLGDV